MNILIAADYATPAGGNFVASCVELGRYLKQKGHGLTFLFPENQNTSSPASWTHWLEREGWTVYRIPRQQPEAQTLKLLRDCIQKHRIDILHLHFGMLHHLVFSHKKELGVKVLVHDHMDFPVGCNLAKQKLWCAMQSLRYRINGIAIASVNPQKDAAYRFARHWYIPNGLSLIRNVERSASREEVRAQLGIRPEEKVCLFLGWDVHRKGLDIAVKAVHTLRQRDPSVLLGIVGLGDPPRQERLQFIADTTGIDPASEWIRYFPSREDMFAYHRAVDVYLSASRSEAFSYGILEAISENTPVAVSDIPGTSWCHSYSKTVVYPVEDANACADALEKALAQGRTASNRDALLQTYGIDIWCSRILSAYQAL